MNCESLVADITTSFVVVFFFFIEIQLWIFFIFNEV